MTPLAAISAHFGRPISADANLIADVFDDSLDAVEVIMSLETEFGVGIDDDAAEGCVTAGDLAGLVAAKRRAA